MPPAFNLSQDQTLQFNLAIFVSPCGPTDLTQSEFTFVSSISCEVLLICLELASRALAQDTCLSLCTHTNRLFLLSFKELFASFRRYRSSEEVRIIVTKNLLSTNFSHQPQNTSRRWLRGQDLNLRPSGYEPDELPDCSTPRPRRVRTI